MLVSASGCSCLTMCRRCRHRPCSSCCWRWLCNCIVSHRINSDALFLRLGFLALISVAVLAVILSGLCRFSLGLETPTSEPEVAASLPFRLKQASGDDDNEYNGTLDDAFATPTDRLNVSTDVVVFLHIQKTGGTTFGRHLVLDLDVDRPCACNSPAANSDSSSTNIDFTDRYHRRRIAMLSVRQQQARLSTIGATLGDNGGGEQSTHRENRRRWRSGSGTGRRSNRLRCECRNAQGNTWLFGRESTGWACGLHADWTELNACVPTALNRIEGRHRKRR